MRRANLRLNRRAVADSKRRGAGAGYQPFYDILPKFHAADVLPSHVDPADFDEGSGMLASAAELRITSKRSWCPFVVLGE